MDTSADVPPSVSGIASEPSRHRIAGPTGSVSYLHWPGDEYEPPVVFLHPVNTAAEIWDELARLIGPGWTCYAVDYRGHGQSSGHGPYLPAAYAEDVLAVVDSLGIPTMHLVGASVGGAVAMELTSRLGPRVRSIALLGADVHFGVTAEEFSVTAGELRRLGLEQWLRAQCATVLGPLAPSHVAGRLVGMNTGRDLETVVEITRATFVEADSRAAAETVRELGPPPSLVATGSEDPTCPDERAQLLSRYLDTSVTTLHGIGHLPMVESPPRTASLIMDFLPRIAGSPEPVGGQR